MDRITSVADAVGRSRVGGAFWANDAETPSVETLVRGRSPDDVAAWAARQPRGQGPTLCWLPQRSAFAPTTAPPTNVLCVFGNRDPWAMLDHANQIWARPDDEIALLASSAGRTVFDLNSGDPVDADTGRRRLARRIAAFDYFDPYDGGRIDVLDWIAMLGRWRTQIDANRQIGAVTGIRGWKRAALRRILWSGRPVTFVREADAVTASGAKALGIWPSRVSPSLISAAASAQVPIARIEDGFVRSIGLGAHLHLPRSVVVDVSGIHYDPSRESDLERILARTDFSDDLLKRARKLAGRLVSGGITKYAAGSEDRIVLPPAARRVLVVGQVEDDLSVRLGGGGVTGNLDLLRRAREVETAAWIAYRPHPDVTAGLRRGHVRERDARVYADSVIGHGSMANLLDQIDCVHVLTSLTGFEALMRACEVVTHGQPFYAGWGLTTDLAPPIARRRRILTLEQLVAGTLILYPRYLDPDTGLPCPPEILIQRHTDAPRPRPGLLNRARMLQGRLLATGRRVAGVSA